MMQGRSGFNGLGATSLPYVGASRADCIARSRHWLSLKRLPLYQKKNKKQGAWPPAAPRLEYDQVLRIPLGVRTGCRG